MARARTLAQRNARTPDEVRRDFCDALAETANVSKSCEIAGVPRRSVYEWRHADEMFAKAWDAALELGSDALEDEAIRRGKDGVLKPVFQGGKKVGVVREYSDTMLVTMLKARRPDKFKDRVSSEHSGPGGGPIETKDVSARDEVARRLARLADRAGPSSDTPGPDGSPS